MIRRDREARLGGYHYFCSWYICKVEVHDGVRAGGPCYWSGSEWVPWDCDAQKYHSRKAASDMMAGFVLTDDVNTYLLEMDQDKHKDSDPPMPFLCSECKKLYAKANGMTKGEIDLMTTFDTRTRAEYDEGILPDTPEDWMTP